LYCHIIWKDPFLSVSTPEPERARLVAELRLLFPAGEFIPDASFYFRTSFRRRNPAGEEKD
jgi:hypothetical protein